MGEEIKEIGKPDDLKDLSEGGLVEVLLGGLDDPVERRGVFLEKNGRSFYVLEMVGEDSDTPIREGVYEVIRYCFEDGRVVIDLDYESTKDLGTYEQYLGALNELGDF